MAGLSHPRLYRLSTVSCRSALTISSWNSGAKVAIYCSFQTHERLRSLVYEQLSSKPFGTEALFFRLRINPTARLLRKFCCREKAGVC